jgi:CRISPR-associated protein Csh1
MFEDMMSQSILSNIRKDEVKTIRFSWNNQIKHKLNIWFSLYNLFNKNKENMESKLEELIIKSKEVAKGEAHINSCEEFAFAAGQIVSFLIDRSVATNKTYSLLEPYLQKVKSGQLQDAIAQSIAVYKHDVSTYKGAFHALASNVLTYDSAIDMKPLLKFFLAGCFADCVIYSKKNSNINE